MNGPRFSLASEIIESRLDDASTPWPLALPTPAPSLLVACPVHPMAMASIQDIYRIAYENAVAATRTSRFELASQACPN
ncbi:hypothetical protein TA3x_001676 [Tundrisphaera sp. TA3]|uniref:hypothetical protein n=1 Tax=Tundrisphaera sp. TA3 TaxID=3435775 RepID=UPI003EBDD8CF